MLDFFSMLFGLAIIGGKKNKNKYSPYQKEMEYIQDKSQEWRNAWEELVIDKELEKEITDRINNDREYRESITQEMKEVFGDMYICRTGVSEDSILEKKRMVHNEIRYLLAKQGKLRYYDVKYGYYTVSLNEERQKEYVFLTWLTNTIKSHIKDDDHPLLKHVELVDSEYPHTKTHIIPISQIGYLPIKTMWNVEYSGYLWDKFGKEYRELHADDGIIPFYIFMGILLIIVFILFD